MFKIGILGAGFMGNTHGICYNNMKGQGFEIAAVADFDAVKAAQVAEIFHAKIYKTADELIQNGDIDILDICLPTYLHKEYILKGMEKGCHILCEKPMALNMEEAAEVMAAYKNYNKIVMTAHCIRFWPEFMMLAGYVQNRSLGRLLSAVFTRVSGRRRKGSSWEDWIVDEKRSGSAVIDLQIHDADFIRSLFGEPDSYQASMYYNHNNPEHIFTQYVFGDTLVCAEAGWDYPTGIFPFNMGYRAVFEKGTVVFDQGAEKKVKVYMEDGELIMPEVVYPNIAPTGTTGNMPAVFGYYNEIEYFIECVKNKKPADRCPLSESFKSLKLVYDVFESSVKKGIYPGS